jgi:hypothetical protein
MTSLDVAWAGRVYVCVVSMRVLGLTYQLPPLMLCPTSRSRLSPVLLPPRSSLLLPPISPIRSFHVIEIISGHPPRSPPLAARCSRYINNPTSNLHPSSQHPHVLFFSLHTAERHVRRGSYLLSFPLLLRPRLSSATDRP